MLIPPEKIQEILDRTDLVALVSRHVELKRSGRSFKGLCPFHAEKGASFHVTPHLRRFKCFGCEAGGDAISFLQRVTGRSFVEVVRDLAREAGVVLEEREDPALKERASLYQANEAARRHFEERLWSHPAAKPGREHLQARGVSQEIARRFCLGYALNSWNDLTARLVNDGILDWGSRAGLIAPRKQSDGFYDVFRGRLMIPIRSIEGRTIAFGARLVEETRSDGEKGPKYLNSRESPVYRKSDTLYGMDVARDGIRLKKQAVLVEGYFDAIGLHAVGVNNAVALCSTALTSGHLQLLARAGATELILLLDGDDAGLKAVERLAGPILAAGATARVALLPTGDDPDTFAQREGLAGVQRLLDGASGLTAHVLDRTLPRGKASGFEDKLSALKKLTPLAEQIPPGLARTLFVSQLAEHLGVAEADVKAHFAQELKPAKAAPRPAPAAPVQNQVRRPLDPSEQLFAALLIVDPSLLANEPDARFIDELHSIEVRLLLSGPNPRAGVGDLPLGLREGIVRAMGEVETHMAEPTMRRKALAESCLKMRLLRANEKLVEKQAELQQLFEAGADDEAQTVIQQEIKDLMRLIQPLKERSKGRGNGAQR